MVIASLALGHDGCFVSLIVSVLLRYDESNIQKFYSSSVNTRN